MTAAAPAVSSDVAGNGIFSAAPSGHQRHVDE